MSIVYQKKTQKSHVKYQYIDKFELNLRKLVKMSLRRGNTMVNVVVIISYKLKVSERTS